MQDGIAPIDSPTRCLRYPEMAHQPDDIVSGLLLGVGVDGLRHIRGRIATGIVGNHLIASGKIAYLRFPAAIVPGKFMAEQQRVAAARDFIIELDAIDGCHGHEALLIYVLGL